MSVKKNEGFTIQNATINERTWFTVDSTSLAGTKV